jgi:beta-glucosidase
LAHTARVRAGRAACRLLLIGDSLTAGWLHPRQGRPAFARHFAGYGAAAYGVGGDGPDSLLARLAAGEVDGLRPRLAALLIGTNGVQLPPAEAVAAGVLRCAADLLDRLPAAELLVLGLPPCAHYGPHLPGVVAAVNAAVAAGVPALGRRAGFLDTAAAFTGPDGAMDRTRYAPDLVHPSAAGYDALAGVLAPAVRDRLGPVPAGGVIAQGPSAPRLWAAAAARRLRAAVRL